jgi:hypothetical protein
LDPLILSVDVSVYIYDNYHTILIVSQLSYYIDSKP